MTTGRRSEGNTVKSSAPRRGRLDRQDRNAIESSQIGSRASALVALRSMTPSLTKAERRAAEFIVSRPAMVVHMSITKLAAEAGIGESTLVRLSTRLGYRGFPALKIAIAQATDNSEPSVSSNVRTDDSLETLLRKVLAAEIQDLRETARLVDLAALEAVVSRLALARHILAYGAGPSSFVALDLSQKLSRIGLLSSGFSDAHLAISAAALAHKNDLAIAFSYSGRTRDSIQYLAQARKSGALTVAVTGSIRSPITREADYTLATSSAEGPLRTGATSSRMAQLYVVDVLFVALATRRYGPTMKALGDAYAALTEHRV